ncbi:MAG TPA: manganese efflux pump [Mycobacteriales bacterium]|nr:manganese efflux pump [Mycobacteriales bacterium]
MIDLRLLGLLLPLALDTFTVSAAIGLARIPARERLRISLVLTAFEAGGPVLGLLLGGPLGTALGAVADYLAIAVLIGFGVFSLFRRESDEGGRLLGAKGPALLLLGLSVSLDELAVGFTLGLLRVPVLPVIIAVAVQTFLASQLGFRLGAALSARVREGAERLAGIALIAIGCVLLIGRLR